MNEIQKEREQIANALERYGHDAAAGFVREMNCKEFGHTRPSEPKAFPCCRYCGAEMAGFREEMTA